jgi:transcriptional regulator with PAS, ATPase and Fis domain
MNTCLNLSLLTEIFINRKYNGKNINDNIRLIGACNPYRRRKDNIEKWGLSLTNDNDNDLVYLVQPFPQSLLYYVFSFGSIDDNDEKKYIYSILDKSFSKEENDLHEITTDAISECHIYLRKIYDPSVVSLREIARFSKCIEFFKDYFKIKNESIGIENNEMDNKLRSIICSIYLCYYIRLTSQDTRQAFEIKLRPILLKLINIDEKDDVNDLFKQIHNEQLKEEINKINEKIKREQIKKFSEFLEIEQDYIIEQIELEKGIGKNTLLKENIFLLFLSVVTNIPLIIIGKPGTGKSLSAKLIYKSMRGKYSLNQFFMKYPQINQIYFQGSESTEPEDLIKLFNKAESKSKSLKKKF